MELLEREQEAQELSAVLRDVEAGQGRVLLVAGEAGIGKTALIEHFAERWQASATVLWGGCEALFTPRPLGPLYDIARQTRGDLLVLLAACETPLMPEETASAPAGARDITMNKHDTVSRDLAEVRRATARFHQLAVAQTAGYELVPGLDHCFTNQPTGDMGYHYIDVASLDLTLDMTRPEAMVYAPGPGGQRMLGAVEYIVPAADWDAEHESPPSLLGHDLHLNEPLGVYVLHAWIWRHNPAGIFEDWNPAVSCD